MCLLYSKDKKSCNDILSANKKNTGFALILLFLFEKQFIAIFFYSSLQNTIKIGRTNNFTKETKR